MAGKSRKAEAFAPIMGAPPSIEWIGVGQLAVDNSYQRSTEAKDSRKHIRAIAERWDWRLCAPLTVSRREDGLFVIDGQHRLEAARMRGDIPHLPCTIARFSSIAEEAGCFVSVNMARKRTTPLDNFRASLASGCEDAIAVQRLIREAGLSLATTTNPTCWLPGQIAGPGAIMSARRRYGETLVMAALTDIATAFEGQVLQYSGSILMGLYPLRAKPPVAFDAAAFRSMLKEGGQQHWYAAHLQRRAKHGETPESAMTYALLDAYALHVRSLAA